MHKRCMGVLSFHLQADDSPAASRQTDMHALHGLEPLHALQALQALLVAAEGQIRPNNANPSQTVAQSAWHKS
jgi:hypothetical protein